MEQREYKIKKALLFPLGADAFLLLCLVMISTMVNGSALETALFTVFFMPAMYLFLESLLRRVTIDEGGISIRRLFGRKRLPWESITHVGGLMIKGKAYILLTTVIGFYIISNAYDRFPLLTEDILSHIGSERVEDEARSLIENTPAGIAGAALAWVAAVLMTGIIALKIHPFIS